MNNSISSISLIILYLPMEWTNYHRRPLWLKIGEKSLPLIIEPPACILAFPLHHDRLISLIKTRLHIRKGERGMLFYRPITLVTYGIGHRFSMLGKIDRFLLRVQVNHILKQIKIDPKRIVEFIVTVHQHFIAGLFRESVRCYEITDEYAVRPGEAQIDSNSGYAKRAIAGERNLRDIADIVFTSSRPLYERKSRIFRNVHYTPNSADVAHFNAAIYKDLKVPADLSSIPPPRIGFTGNLIETVDFRLICDLALSRPNYSIVLLGNESAGEAFKNSAAYMEAKSLPNVIFLGFREYDDLPAYLKGIDVCILPHLLTEWMRNSFPNKMIQYLAAGRAVVATDFPSVQDFEEVILIAHNRPEFIKLVDQAIARNDDPGNIEKRLKVANRYSTETRADQILKLLYSSVDKQLRK